MTEAREVNENSTQIEPEARLSIVIDADPMYLLRKLQRLGAAVLTLLGALAVVWSFQLGGLEGIYTGSPDTPGTKPNAASYLMLGGAAAMLVGGGFAMLAYLRPSLLDPVMYRAGSGSERLPSEEIAQMLLGLQRQVHELRSVDKKERMIDANAVASRLLPTVQESILETLQTKYAKESLEADRVAEGRRVYIALENRLRLEIDALGRRGNINLTIGVFTTLLAVVALAFMVFTSDRQFGSMVDVLSHYVPRLALVAFIEVFSFFFLRLYRSTLEEIRFYQERMNDAATQRVAIEIAWELNDPASRAEFAKTLLNSRKGRAEAAPAGGAEVDVNALTKVVGQLVKLVPTGGGKQG